MTHHAPGVIIIVVYRLPVYDAGFAIFATKIANLIEMQTLYPRFIFIELRHIVHAVCHYVVTYAGWG